MVDFFVFLASIFSSLLKLMVLVAGFFLTTGLRSSPTCTLAANTALTTLRANTAPAIPTASFFCSSATTRKKSARMPPKKAAAPAEKARLGKVSNNLKMGIVGMPNVGKSSLFNVLAKADLGKAANFPYATIDPEESRVAVPDERFTWLCDLYKPKNEVPAFLTCIDIAGLTAGASTGAGLGNAFLSHVRAVDGIFQVVRAFADDEIIHVEGDVDPCRDMKIISNELRLKDIEWTEKMVENSRKIVKSAGSVSLEDKKKKEELAAMEKVLHLLSEEDKDVRKGDWTSKEIDVINGMQLLTAKPVIYLVNLSETDYVRKKNKWLPKIKEWIDKNNPGDQLIPFSVALEERLMALGGPDKEAEELKKLGDNVTGSLGKIIKSGYDALQLIKYYTVGEPETRAWTIQKGIKAPQAAGVIHSDFENKFICGMKFSYDDLKEFGNESRVQAAGKVSQIGKTYTMVDGDIVTWKCGQ